MRLLSRIKHAITKSKVKTMWKRDAKEVWVAQGAHCAVTQLGPLGVDWKITCMNNMLSMYSIRSGIVLADSFNYATHRERVLLSLFFSQHSMVAGLRIYFFLFWCRGSHMTYYLLLCMDDALKNLVFVLKYYLCAIFSFTHAKMVRTTNSTNFNS